MFGYISRATPSFSHLMTFHLPAITNQTSRKAWKSQIKLFCWTWNTNHILIYRVVSVHFNKTLFFGSEGSQGRKKMNLDPSSEVHRASPFVSLLKISLLFRAMHLQMVQSEFLHTWCENGLSLSMKALIMHWNLRRSCKVTAPEQCSQISHNRFSTSKIVGRGNGIWTWNKNAVLKFSPEGLSACT